MKKLFIGNNGYNTDSQVEELAVSDNQINQGLLANSESTIHNGYYHTSVIDLSPGDIVAVANQFDQIILLDQPRNEWSHWKPMLTSYKIMLELEKLGHNTIYKNNKNTRSFETFYKLVHEDNPSFCIYPFILQTEDLGHVTLCARSSTKVEDSISSMGNFKDNKNFKDIRQKMLQGEKLPEHCRVCYDYEEKGIESSRQFETMDWVSKLELETLDDLEKLDHPHYYEIRLSNKCNLMCRSCRPEHSHLIEKEYKIHNIQHPSPVPFSFSNFDHVDIPSLNNKSRIYLTGGEPTVMREFYDFCDKCIELGHTDFDFTIGTNGQTYTPKFWDTVKHFSNMNFTVSIDGYGKYNDYQRWGSDYDTVIKNSKELSKFGTVSFLIVPGMYNITNLHLLLEDIDQHFPTTGLYLQINHNELETAYNHPRPDLVIESMKRCQQTEVYRSDGRSCKSTIDSILNYYENNPELDHDLLRRFFEYNDKIDSARGVRLADYIPELDNGRKLLG